jgi:nitroreductase
MDTFEAVRTVLAVRKYQDKPISEDNVRRILEAGRLTASSRNDQPWHFIAVQNKEALGTLGSLARSGPYTADAALAVVLAYEKDSIFGVSDVSRAAQSMMLTAWEMGIGSNWVGFGGLDSIRDVLMIPNDITPFAIIAFGYPEQRLGRGKKNRKALNEVAHRETFGQPYE